MALITSRVWRAHLAELNFLANSLSSSPAEWSDLTARSIAIAISSGSYGSQKNAAPRKISGSEPARDTTTGHPNDSASSGGRPKPSYKDGNMKQEAFSYKALSSMSVTYPNERTPSGASCSGKHYCRIRLRSAKVYCFCCGDKPPAPVVRNSYLGYARWLPEYTFRRF